MAKQKRKATVKRAGEIERNVPVADKIARLLALIVIKDMEADAAALSLDGVGFGAREISELLGVGPNYVNVAKHRKKSASAKSRKLRVR